MRIVFPALILAVMAAQPASSGVLEGREVTVHLHNNGVFRGEVIRENQRKIDLAIPGGVMTIDKRDVREIRKAQPIERGAPPDEEKPEPTPTGETPATPAKSDAAPDNVEPKPSGDQPAVKKTEETEKPSPIKNIVADYAAGKVTKEGVIEALKKEGETGLRTLIEIVVKNAEPLVTVDMINVLGMVKASAAIKEIVPFLASDDLRLRVATVNALKEIGGPDAVRPLVKTLGDPENGVACHAVDALVTLHNADKASADRVMHTMMEALFTGDDRLRMRVTMVFGQLDTPAAFEYIMRIAREERGEAKLVAMRYLGQKKDPGALDLLLLSLEDGDGAVRATACSSLGLLGDSRPIPDLIERLKDDVRDVKERAHWALKQITKQKFAIDYGTWNTWWNAGGVMSSGQ